MDRPLEEAVKIKVSLVTLWGDPLKAPHENVTWYGCVCVKQAHEKQETLSRMGRSRGEVHEAVDVW